MSREVVHHHIDLDHESRRIVVRQVESNLPMLVSAFEAPSLVESQAALQADYSGAPREGSLSSVSSVVHDSEVDPHRHHMHESPSSSAERPRPTTGSLSRACRPRRLHVPRDRQGLQRLQLRRRTWAPTGVRSTDALEFIGDSVHRFLNRATETLGGRANISQLGKS